MIVVFCFCGSGKEYQFCCQLYLEVGIFLEMVEVLMCLCYIVYVWEDIVYLKVMLWLKYQFGFDFVVMVFWVVENYWIGLIVLEMEKGGLVDWDGLVLFEVKYLGGGCLNMYWEKSLFCKKVGCWYYVEVV